jgi:hypothetical protein
MTGFPSTPKLDCSEQHFRFPGPRDGLPLFLRFLPATRTGTISEIGGGRAGYGGGHGGLNDNRRE